MVTTLILGEEHVHQGDRGQPTLLVQGAGRKTEFRLGWTTGDVVTTSMAITKDLVHALLAYQLFYEVDDRTWNMMEACGLAAQRGEPLVEAELAMRQLGRERRDNIMQQRLIIDPVIFDRIKDNHGYFDMVAMEQAIEDDNVLYTQSLAAARTRYYDRFMWGLGAAPEVHTAYSYLAHRGPWLKGWRPRQEAAASRVATAYVAQADGAEFYAHLEPLVAAFTDAMKGPLVETLEHSVWQEVKANARFVEDALESVGQLAMMRGRAKTRFKSYYHALDQLVTLASDTADTIRGVMQGRECYGISLDDHRPAPEAEALCERFSSILTEKMPHFYRMPKLATPVVGIY